VLNVSILYPHQFNFLLKVQQQADYVRKQMDDKSVRVAEMCGQEIDYWDQASWQNALKNNDVFVGTPATFCSSFVDKGFLSASSFSLVILDECHNATGNSPMASLLRDAIFRLHPSQQPRIVGLTASFVNGSMKDIIKKREKLEVLMQANLISPNIDAETTMSRQFIRIIVPYEDLATMESLVSRFVMTIFRNILKNVILQIEVEKWTVRAKIVFAGTGGEGLLFWLKEGILLQLSNEAEELLLRSESACLSKGRIMKIGVDAARNALLRDNNGSFINNFPRFTKKAQSLLDLLWQLYSHVLLLCYSVS